MMCFHIKTIISVLTCYLKGPAHPPHSWDEMEACKISEPALVAMAISQVAEGAHARGPRSEDNFSFGGFFKFLMLRTLRNAGLFKVTGKYRNNSCYL